MKELIDERPSIVPVGLGNNNTDIDMSDYLPAVDDDLDLEQSEGVIDLNESEEGPDHEGGEVKQDEDDEPVPTARDRKCKATADEKKTGARPGLSAPSVPGPGGVKKPRNMMDRFAETAKAEETTTQKQLEVKRARIELQKATEVAKIQAQANIQISQNQIKGETKLERLRLDQEKMRMEHEFRMAQLHAHQRGIVVNPLAPLLTQPSSSFTAHSSHHGHSTPESVSTSYDDARPFDLNNFDFSGCDAGGPGLRALLDADLAQEGAGTSGV
jgi:hypothetical protein